MLPFRIEYHVGDDPMQRYKKPYTLFKRGKIWYYRLGNDPKRIPHSTGKTLKAEAANVLVYDGKNDP